MPDVLVLGGGFAGVWSAAAAVRAATLTDAELSVTLVAPGEDLVIRPRLYEAEARTATVPLDQILAPIGVRHLRARATDLDATGHTVRLLDSAGQSLTVDFERLVLATGSQLRQPAIAGAEHLFDVDTLEGAIRLDDHLSRLPEAPDELGRFTAVVVGAGFTGIEVATELVGRLQELSCQLSRDEADVQVALVERADVVAPDLGAGPRPIIIGTLNDLGIDVRLGSTITSLSAKTVRFDDGSELAAHTVVWTAGMTANHLTGQVPGSRDGLGRLRVDAHLRVPESPAIFAAGDTAVVAVEPGRDVMQSCQHAIPLGKYAGHNAAADLLGEPLAAFQTTPYVTCLDLGPAGGLFTTGFERKVALTGAEGKERKRLINRQWIYPPIRDANEILWAADYRISTREGARTRHSTSGLHSS